MLVTPVLEKLKINIHGCYWGRSFGLLSVGGMLRYGSFLIHSFLRSLRMFIRCEGSASQSSGVLRLMWGFLIQGYAGIGPFFIGVFAYFWFMPHDCAFIVRGVSEANYSGGYASMEWCSE